jgi:hypothetical protein
MVSGTATYSAIYPGTIIYEDNAGSVTTVVSETSAPARGTFTTTAGRKYYGNKPIHLLDETGNGGECLVPLTLTGRYFGSYPTRYGNATYYMYSPLGDATVSVYDNVVGGVTGSATTTVTVNQGTSNTYVTATLSAPVIFASDLPIVMTGTQDTGDASIISPASTNVYKRRSQYNFTINNTTPGTVGTYYTGDSLPSFAVAIADGSGGDMEQGLGLENLSDTYSFGNVLSDYQIVAPYASTTVNVSYWNGSAWVLGESHSLSGSLTSPDAVDRDGTNGFGVDGTTISGGAANLGSGATLWKWEGNNPFYLLINDSVDDEETLMGWRSNRDWYDLSTSANHGTMAASNPVFNSNGSSSSFTFDGNTSSFTVDATNIDFSTEQTIIMFLKPEEVGVSTRNPYNQEFAGYGAITQALTGGYIYYHGIGGANYQATGSFNSQLANNEIGSIAVARNSSTVQWYKNGEPKESANNTYPTANSTVNTITIGDGYTNGWLGEIYLALLYDRALSNNEISQTYNALKGRFGL